MGPDVPTLREPTRREVIGEALWALFLLLMYWSVFSDTRPNAQHGSLAVFQCLGCYFVAKHRGRSGWWTLVGLASVFSLALPCLLRPRGQEFSGRRRAARWACAAGIVVLGFAVVTASVVQASRAGAAPARESDWRTCDVLGIRLVSPVAFASPVRAPVPHEAAQMLDSADSCNAIGDGGKFVLTVVRRTLRPEFAPELEAYVDEVLRASAAILGGTIGEVRVTPWKVSGREGSRGESTFVLRGRASELHALATQEGQVQWLVLVVHNGVDASGDARRILASVTLPPAPPR